MGLLDLFNNGIGTGLSNYQATQQLNNLQQSILHNTYSINNNPNATLGPGGSLPQFISANSYIPSPSGLDLDGVTPPQYVLNPPQ
jgi:hypothetical protein